MAQGDIPQADPLNILMAGMEQDAGLYTEQAKTQIAQAQTTLSAGDVTSKDILNDTLKNQRQVIMVVPKGKSFDTFGKNVNVALDPNGDTVVFKEAPKLPHPSDLGITKTTLDPQKSAAEILDNAGKPPTEFNVDATLASFKDLSGDALDSAVKKANIDINMALSRAHQRVSRMAMLKSGAMQAQLALEKNIQLDQTSGFTEKTQGQFSAQTQEAQNTLQQALQTSNQLLVSFMKDDTEVAKLLAAQGEMVNVERKRMLRGEREQDKTERAIASVTPSELTNYKLIYGTTGDDQKDMQTIAARRDRDKVLGLIVQGSPENIFELLTHPDGKVRKEALKLVLQYDIAAHPEKIKGDGGIPKDAMSTPMTQLLKKYIDDPSALVDAAPNLDVKKKKDLKEALAKPMGTAERAAQYHSELASHLASIVEQGKDNFFKGDVSNWRASEISGTSPLAASVTAVKNANKRSEAPLSDVIGHFITSVVNAPDGTEMQFKPKLDLLLAGLDGAAANQYKSLVFANPEGSKMRIAEFIKNEAARAYAVRKTFGETPNGILLNNYMQHKGYVK